MQAASQATVPSVRSLGQKMPLRLRVCGRGATGAAGAATVAAGGEDDGPEDADEGWAGPVGESVGADDPEPTGEAGRAGDA